MPNPNDPDEAECRHCLDGARNPDDVCRHCSPALASVTQLFKADPPVQSESASPTQAEVTRAREIVLQDDVLWAMSVLRKHHLSRTEGQS